MNNYTKFNWEYSEEEKLDIDRQKLSDAQLKLTNPNINFVAKKFYEKEITHLETSIATRVLKIQLLNK